MQLPLCPPQPPPSSVPTFQEPVLTGQNGFALQPPPANVSSSSSSYLCPLGGGGCPGCGLLGWSPSHRHQADKRGREVRRRRRGAGRRTLREAAQKVGVGVSQPRRRRRKKEVGELRRIVPSCQLSVSRSGREGGSQLVCGPELLVGNQVMENDGWRAAEKSSPSPPPLWV